MKSLELLNDLLKINSIKISINKSFSWASGWKSPLYFDNRISLSYPKIRKEISKSNQSKYDKYYFLLENN